MRYLVNIEGIDPRGQKEGDAQLKGTRGIRAARLALGDSLGAHPKRCATAWNEALEVLSDDQTYALGGSDRLDVATHAAEAAQEASGGVLRAKVTEDTNTASVPLSEALSAPEDPYEVEARVYRVEICDLCEHEVSYVPEDPEGCHHEGETTFKDCILLEDLALGATLNEGGSPFSWEAIAYALTTLASQRGNIDASLMVVNSYARHAEPETWGEVRAMLIAAFNPESA